MTDCTLTMNLTPNRMNPEQSRPAAVTETRCTRSGLDHPPKLENILAMAVHCLASTSLLALILSSLPGCSRQSPTAAAANSVRLQSSTFASEPISDSAAQARDALHKDDLERADRLLKDASDSEKGVAALRLGLDLARANMVDPLSNFAYTHDFDENSGAFLPNGRINPLHELERRAAALIKTDPSDAPHVADAISLAIALQLSKATENDLFIAMSDDILFSETTTSAPRRMFETIPFEVLCSTPAARSVHMQNRMRAALLQKLKGQLPFFGVGLWVGMKHHAKTIDAASVERWRPHYLAIAEKLFAKGRFASGCEVIIYGAHMAPWDALLAAAEKLAPDGDGRETTNLKIAFAYVCQSSRFWKTPLPTEPGSSFTRLKEQLLRLGDRNQTKYAFEASGLEIP
jgi:hypothetical protein